MKERSRRYTLHMCASSHVSTRTATYSIQLRISWIFSRSRSRFLTCTQAPHPVQVRTSSAVLRMQLAEIDTDSNGSIDRGEWLTCALRHVQPHFQPHPKPHPKLHPSVHACTLCLHQVHQSSERE